jgi:hypothetical protein
MIMHTSVRRSLAAALTGALALSTISLAPAEAAGSGVGAKQDTITLSARRHHSPGGAIVLGAVAGLFGTIAALAARDRYYDDYYGPYPYYYSAPRAYYYAPAYPRHRYYRHFGGPALGGHAFGGWHGHRHHH